LKKADKFIFRLIDGAFSIEKRWKLLGLDFDGPFLDFFHESAEKLIVTRSSEFQLDKNSLLGIIKEGREKPNGGQEQSALLIVPSKLSVWMTRKPWFF
jgi:hypothetical protein